MVIRLNYSIIRRPEARAQARYPAGRGTGDLEYSNKKCVHVATRVLAMATGFMRYVYG